VGAINVVLSLGEPNRMTLLMPSAFAPRSLTASSTERLKTPASTHFPDAFAFADKQRQHEQSGERRVSRTSARIVSERRSRRSRRVIVNAVGV
jgi:hypothetical protein